jgi:hypothetical protein
MLGTDMKVAETPKDGLKDFVLADPYAEWLKSEGVTVYEDFYFPSLAKLELAPWQRKGGSGAVICPTIATSSILSPAGNPNRNITCTS